MYRKAFEISFVEEVLGTASANPEVYAKFIQAKGESNA